MNRAQRIQKLEELKSRSNPAGGKTIFYKGRSIDLPAYKIPIHYLIFNQHNGRISTYVKTHNLEHEEIDPNTPEGEDIIINFLWKSKEHRNRETAKDLKIKGQMEIGIVTKDGVIIDGNRRCMLIKKNYEEDPTNSPNEFRAVILDDSIEDDSKEIRALETRYQMGVDERVDYNPIEKYLKCKDLKGDGYSEKDIAELMGEKEKDIKKYLSTLALMEEFLEAYDYAKVYALLNDAQMEGPFVDLANYLERYKSKSRIKALNWNPSETDIDDLKNVILDYIRAGFRTTHDIRKLGNPASRDNEGQGIFSNKQIWESFLEKHKEIDKITDDEDSLEDWRTRRQGEPIIDIIRARDDLWKKQVGTPSSKNSKLQSNLRHNIRRLENLHEAQSPFSLLEKAIDALGAIDTSNEAFSTKKALEIVKEINSMTWKFQQHIKRVMKEQSE